MSLREVLIHEEVFVGSIKWNIYIIYSMDFIQYDSQTISSYDIFRFWPVLG